MARTTISLPDDLKARMDAANEPVNWSQVAAHAFEVKLGELASRKQKAAMTDVIQRLRASKLECDHKDSKAGFEDGKQWAQRRAKWRELEKLHAALADEWFWRDELDRKWWPHTVLAAMGSDDPDRHEVEEFWEMFGEPDPSQAWLQGFCDGAMSVYEDVRHEI